MYLHFPACSARTQTCLYTIKCSHIIVLASSHHHPVPPTLPQPPSCQMGPKPKPNTRSGAFRAPPDSRKRQVSNADQQPTKRTRRTANNTNNEEDEEPESEEEQEEASGADNDDHDHVVDPPPLRGGKRGRGLKIGPPRRYVGRDHQRSRPYFSLFSPF